MGAYHGPANQWRPGVGKPILSSLVRTPSAITGVVTVFKGGTGYDSAKLRAAAAGKVGLN